MIQIKSTQNLIKYSLWQIYPFLTFRENFEDLVQREHLGLESC